MMRILLAVLLGLAAAAAGAEPTPAINAVECGASGSQFATTAATTAGSKQITVKDLGDFRAGQGVMVSRCNIHVSHSSLWGPRSKYAASGPLKELVEMRGFDGSQGSWVVYVLDVDGPGTFRWTDDLGRTWQGKATKITYDWQPLANGVEVRFKQFPWADGYSVVIAYRDQLITTIEKVEGNVLTLKDAANRSANDATVRHNDGLALQAAIDQAIKEKRNVFVPPGWYRIAGPLRVVNAGGISIEGANGVDTVLDISEGEGACFQLRNGTEVSIRNLAMVGHSGFKERGQCGSLSTRGGTALWGFYYRFCAALGVSGTERVLVENCHARRMSGECFYSGGPGRFGDRPEPKQYTKEITYLRCTVEDCGRNAFNNNDHAENTRVLYCRIRDVGGCSWEGASRFVQFQGNYVRNGGTVAMGNIRSRDGAFEVLPSGQHIVADNVFEEGVCYGGCAVRACDGATQVIIKNNLFINHGTSAVEILGGGTDLPAGQSTITGNLFDMTSAGQYALNRHAIQATASDVTISDNQIYVRGDCDPKVTAIRLGEPAVNLNVSNNLIRNCGAGFSATRARGRVSEVADPQTFAAANGVVPLERRLSHRYRGWNVVWFRGGQPAGRSVIEAFDPEKLTFRLTAPREVKVGDGFEVYPPDGPNWSIHDNTITDCQAPVTLDVYGGPSALFADNILSRGSVTGVKQALDLRDRFRLEGNQFSGFNEAGSSALALSPDRLGEPIRLLCRGNVFQACANVVSESTKGLWDAVTSEGNTFIDCGLAPRSGGTSAKTPVPAPIKAVAAPSRATLRAPAPPKVVAIDGGVTEWPWNDKSRVATLEQTPMGDTIRSPRSHMLAASDGLYLYVALRVVTLPGYKLQPATAPYDGDGMEVAFGSGEARASSATLMLYGSASGSLWAHPAGGATAAQMAQLEKETKYAVKAGKEEWTAEWRIPLSVLGSDHAKVRRLLFNVGLLHKSADLWVAWVGTGAEIFRVENAGDVVLGK